MERIRDAVEQARRDRAKVTGKPLPQETTKSAVESGEHQSVAEPEDSAQTSRAQYPSEVAPVQYPTEDFTYSETRCITVSQQVREQNRLVAAIPNHPLLDVYRMLRTRVLQEMRANNWQVLAVTSPASGSGKSLTAINLAISIGRDLSSTALLIDGDLRQPSFADYFGYEPEFGISDFLNKNVPLSQCVFHPDMDRLVVLPGRERISESAEMLASDRIAAFIKEARSRYDDRIIVVDTAPVLSVDDVLALAPNVDCLLMVAESGETKREDLGQALELLQGIPIIGTVLNKVDKKVAEAY